MDLPITLSSELRASATPLGIPHATPADAASRFLDPLDGDRPDDEVIVTTRRALYRVALVATETAARFQRDGIACDSMSWMLSPRRLFGGAAAIDACLDRDACLRGILVHGLSLGLDVDPELVDALAADEDEEDDCCGDDAVVGDCDRDRHEENGHLAATDAFSSRLPRLFTATVVADLGFETVHAFHASMAVDEAEVAGRLYCRIGAACADAVIMDGFDPGDPLVGALVSGAIADMLAQVAADPCSPLADGLDLNVEQRFHG